MLLTSFRDSSVSYMCMDFLLFYILKHLMLFLPFMKWIFLPSKNVSAGILTSKVRVLGGFGGHLDTEVVVFIHAISVLNKGVIKKSWCMKKREGIVQTSSGDQHLYQLFQLQYWEKQLYSKGYGAALPKHEDHARTAGGYLLMNASKLSVWLTSKQTIITRPNTSLLFSFTLPWALFLTIDF